ncbi:hypothetical protein ACOME3_002011 [Neoechinorhynchus agilis]
MRFFNTIRASKQSRRYLSNLMQSALPDEFEPLEVYRDKERGFFGLGTWEKIKNLLHLDLVTSSKSHGLYRSISQAIDYMNIDNNTVVVLQTLASRVNKHFADYSLKLSVNNATLHALIMERYCPDQVHLLDEKQVAKKFNLLIGHEPVSFRDSIKQEFANNDHLYGIFVPRQLRQFFVEQKPFLQEPLAKCILSNVCVRKHFK